MAINWRGASLYSRSRVRCREDEWTTRVESPQRKYLPLFAVNADLLVHDCRFNFNSTATHALAHHELRIQHRDLTHKPVARLTAVCSPSPATSRAILTLVSVRVLSRGCVRRQVANQRVARAIWASRGDVPLRDWMVTMQGEA